MISAVSGCIELGLIAYAGVPNRWPSSLQYVSDIAMTAALLATAMAWLWLLQLLERNRDHAKSLRKVTLGFAAVFLMSFVATGFELLFVAQLQSPDWRQLMVESIVTLGSLVASVGLAWLALSARQIADTARSLTLRCGLDPSRAQHVKEALSAKPGAGAVVVASRPNPGRAQPVNRTFGAPLSPIPGHVMSG